MRFLIIGAGAIGGSAGACLARGGHEVLLVDSDIDHVHAIQTSGLTMEGRLDFTIPIPATTPEGMRAVLGGRPPEVVILAVKSQHTEAALSPLLPLLGPDSTVLSVQNGLNPHHVIRQVGAGRTVAAFVNSMGTDYQSPGRIMYGGSGTMFIGELDGRVTDRVHRLVSTFKECFVESAQATDNIWGYLWGKEGFSAMLFAGAVTDITIADLLADPQNRNLLADIAAEVMRVADAEGIRCEAFDGYEPGAMRFTRPRDCRPRDWGSVEQSLARLEQRYRPSLKPKSGIWRDLVVRRRKTEVDAQLGIVSAIATPHGIAVPLIDRVVAMIHEIEDGARSMQPENLAALRELDRQIYPDGQTPSGE